MDWTNALWAGFAGGVAMWVMMTLARWMGVVEANMTAYQGCMLTRKAEGAGTVLAGLVMHLVASALIGLIYAWTFEEIWGYADWTSGATNAVVHWLIAGMLLQVMDGMSPCVKEGRIRPFGAFGKGYGPMMLFGFFLGHFLYGAVVGWIYTVPAV